MNFWSRLRYAFTGQRGSPRRAVASFPEAAGRGAPLWSDSRVEQVRHFKHWVYVAVHRTAEKVAQQIPQVARVRYARGSSGLSRAPGTSPEAADMVPVGHLHPLTRLLCDPNPDDTAFDLWYETVLHLSLTGSAYWWVPPNGAGLPAEIYVLPSHWVWPVGSKDGGKGYYQVRPVEGYNLGGDVPQEDMIVFRRKSPLVKWDGTSPQQAGAQWVDGIESINSSRWHAQRNGVTPPVLVEFDETVADVDDATLDRIHARLQARYAGEVNSKRPLVLPPGSRVKPLFVSVREMDFHQSFEQLRDSILALFGVPAVIAGITKDMTYGSVLAAQAGFCAFVINPMLSYIGQVITEKLAWRYDKGLRVYWDDATPEDPTARDAAVKHMVAARAIGVNEVRSIYSAYGLKPWPDGCCPDDDMVAGVDHIPEEDTPLSEQGDDKPDAKPDVKPKPRPQKDEESDR